MKPLTGFEADLLASRWRVEQRAVLKWMVARGFESTMDFVEAFPGTHSESMAKALADFWEFST